MQVTIEVDDIKITIEADDIGAVKFLSDQIWVVMLGGESEDKPGWSEKAIADYGAEIEKCSAEIASVYEKAANGIPFSEASPLPVPPTAQNIKRYVANIYDIEVSDVQKCIEINS